MRNVRIYVGRVLIALAFADLLFMAKAFSDWMEKTFILDHWWWPFAEWYWSVGSASLFFVLLGLAWLLKPTPSIRVETPMVDDSHTFRI